MCVSLVLAKRRQLPPPPAALRPSGLVFPAGWSPLSWVTGLEAGTRPGYAAVPASSWVWPERLQGRVGPIAHSSSRLPAAQLCPQSSVERCPVSSGVASHTSCHDRSVAGAGGPSPQGCWALTRARPLLVERVVMSLLLFRVMSPCFCCPSPLPFPAVRLRNSGSFPGKLIQKTMQVRCWA